MPDAPRPVRASMRRRRSSENLRDARRFQRMRRVGTGLFGAQPRARKHLVGIGYICWIECAAHQLHGGEIGLGEHVAHGFLLLLAYAMLAGDGAAMVDAEAENAIGKLEGP